jgi:hypothetical protein
MGKVAISIISLVVGVVIGGIGAMTIGGGLIGIGVGTGLSAGICMTIEAAEELGLMNDEQVDQVLTKAAENISGVTELPEDQKIVGSAEQCKEVMAKLKQQQQ